MWLYEVVVDKSTFITMHRRSQMMRRSIKVGSIAFIALVMIIFVFPMFIDWNQYRQGISQELEKFLNAEVTIYGDIEGSILPMNLKVAHVRVKYPEQEGYNASFASITELDIDMSLLSIFSSSPIINKIVVHEPYFSLNQLKTIRRSNNSSIIVDIMNGKVNLFSDLSSFSKYIEGIDGKLKVSGNNISMDSSLYINNHLYNIEIESKEDDLEFQIKSDYFEISFDGEESKDGIRGKAKGNGDKFHLFIADLFGFSSAYNKKEDNFKISAEFSLSDKAFYIKDIELESEYISGTGYVVSDWSKGFSNYEIKVDLDEFDFDDMLYRYNSLGGSSLYDLMDLLYVNIDRSTTAGFDLDFSNVLYNNNKINSVIISGKANDGSLRLESLKAKFLDGTMIALNGATNSNDVRTEFRGELNLYSASTMPIFNMFSPDYIKIQEEKENKAIKMKSNLTIQPSLISFSDIDASVGNGKIDGIISLKKYDDSPKVLGSINVEDIDLNDYQFDINSSSKDLIWLRNIKKDIGITFDMNNVTINDTTIENLSFIMETEESSLMLNQIEFVSDKSKFNANLSLISSEIVPKIDLYVKAESLDLNIFGNTGLYTVEFDEVDKSLPVKFSWSNDEFDLMGISKFNGRLAFVADEIKNNDVYVGKAHLNGELLDGTFIIKECVGSIYDGKLVLNGSVDSVSSRRGIKLGFALNNMNLGSILHATDTDVSGYMSMNGNIGGYGTSLHQIVSTLSGKYNFVIRNLEYNHLSIDKIIDGLDYVESRSGLVSLVNQSLKGGKTLFNNISGKSHIANGVGVLSFNFATNRATGSSVTHFYFNQFIVNSLMRWSFRTPMDPNRTLSADMKVKGLILKPERYFDTSTLEKQIHLGTKK